MPKMTPMVSVVLSSVMKVRTVKQHELYDDVWLLKLYLLIQRSGLALYPSHTPTPPESI